MGKKILTNVIIPLCCIVLLGLYAVNANNLTNIRSQLAATQIDLTAAQTSIALSNTTLEGTETLLSLTQSDLEKANELLSTTTNQLKSANTELDQTKADYHDTLEDLNEEKNLSGQQSVTINNLQANIENLQANIKSLTVGYGYVMSDPTYAQMTAFLTTDNTNRNPYVDDIYVCEDFAYDVITHAMQMKYRCAFVSIRYPDSAHAIIAFNTTDRGLIFIEPQSDEQVNLVVGRHFWQCIVTAPGYYYATPSYDDTIIRYNVIW